MNVFGEISIIIVLATTVAGIMHLLRQPLIIGHIITGLIVGPSLLNILHSTEVFDVFSELGIALLLFIVGLGLNPKLIKEVGLVSLITGTGQVIFTSLIGFVIATALGFSVQTSIYIAIALTFSSTIIIVKLLSDKNDLQKLYGKISLGFLLVQDIIAAFILIGMSAFATGNGFGDIVSTIAIKGALLIVGALVISTYVLPYLSSFFARSQEFLFLFSMSWGLGLATLFSYFGFSIEIGALVAGISLSMSPYHLEISAKMRPLRDFFIVLFFIFLGSKMVLASLTGLMLPVIIFSGFVLIGNPLIVMALMGMLGYSKKIGFFAGLTVAQISEFSLIIILLGMKLGTISPDEPILALVTMVALITIAGSTYMIMYSDKLYELLKKPLSIFERDDVSTEKSHIQKYDIILFGHNRIGYDFIKTFQKLKKTFLIVDFDPKIIAYLTKKGIDSRYGDADDAELLEEMSLDSTKLIVSTIPEVKTNLLIIRHTRKNNDKAIIIVIAHSIKEAEKLYHHGATYVILPHFLGGVFASNMIAKFGLNRSNFSKERTKHLAYIKKRKKLGHELPKHEKF